MFPLIWKHFSSYGNASPKEVYLITQLRFSVPRLLQLMNMAENLRFDGARFRFSDKRVDAVVYPHGEFGLYPPNCPLLTPRPASIFYGTNFRFSLPIFLAVEHPTLEQKECSQLPEDHNKVDRTKWRKLLRPFRNVKTLRIEDGLIEGLSRCLELDGGELL